MKTCTAAFLFFVIFGFISSWTFIVAIFPSEPNEIRIDIKSFYSDNIQHTACSESPIFEVTGERYYMHDNFLLVELHANVTPPEKETFEEYLKKENIDADKWICELHIKTWESLPYELDSSSLKKGYVVFLSQEQKQMSYPIMPSGQESCYEVEYPVNLLREEQSVTFEMYFDIVKLPQILRIEVDSHISKASGYEDYYIELILPYIYTWDREFGGEDEWNKSENKSSLIFEDRGEGTITASATRPMKLDMALLFSAFVWLFGFAADAFVRTCSLVDRMRKLFHPKEKGK
ncbi:MAG: hypothetical protein AYK19_01915 [Theionarchaea archaeon DG-70-1]|nr:MAG: hypothetical protein AYK19_01915 [Theionarchaea archaeon DG-70-1]